MEQICLPRLSKSRKRHVNATFWLQSQAHRNITNHNHFRPPVKSTILSIFTSCLKLDTTCRFHRLSSLNHWPKNLSTHRPRSHDSPTSGAAPPTAVARESATRGMYTPHWNRSRGAGSSTLRTRRAESLCELCRTHRRAVDKQALKLQEQGNQADITGRSHLDMLQCQKQASAHEAASLT